MGLPAAMINFNHPHLKPHCGYEIRVRGCHFYSNHSRDGNERCVRGERLRMKASEDTLVLVMNLDTPDLHAMAYTVFNDMRVLGFYHYLRVQYAERNVNRSEVLYSILLVSRVRYATVYLVSLRYRRPCKIDHGDR